MMFKAGDKIHAINRSDAEHTAKQTREAGYKCHVEQDERGRWAVVIDGKEELKLW